MIYQRLFLGNAELGIVKRPDSVFEGKLKELHGKLSVHNKRPVFLGYSGTLVRKKSDDADYPEVSLNHFYLAKYLRDNLHKADSVADIGCGSGFLGSFCYKEFSPKTVHFISDNNRDLVDAVRSFVVNANKGTNGTLRWENDGKSNRLEIAGCWIDFRYEVALGNAIIRDKVDVSVSCPLVIPFLFEPIKDTIFWYAHAAKNISQVFYLAHSSLCDPEVEIAARHHNASLDCVYSRDTRLIINNDDLHFLSRDNDLAGIISSLEDRGLSTYDDESFAHTLKISRFEF